MYMYSNKLEITHIKLFIHMYIKDPGGSMS